MTSVDKVVTEHSSKLGELQKQLSDIDGVGISLRTYHFVTLMLILRGFGARGSMKLHEHNFMVTQKNITNYMQKQSQLVG